MDPIRTMEEHKDQFTPNDQQIYEHIMANPEAVSYQSTIKLSEDCGVSQSALSRFVKMLGYERYQDFRSDMTAWVAQQHVSEDPNRLFYFERLERLMRAAEQVLTDEYLRELAAYVRAHDRIFVTGIGKSLEPGRLLAHLLRKTERFVHVAPLDTLKEHADHMGENDLLIVFSISAQGEVMKPTAYANGDVLLVTTRAAHGYADSVDRTVVLPFLPPDPELCAVSPVLFDVFVELLVQYLQDADGDGR